MPFGFDPVENEKFVNEIKDEISAVYVDVTVRWFPDGKMIPLSFSWGNGKEYTIDKVLAVREGHSLKQFSSGKRYYCQTGKRRYYLHFDGEKWYIEVKKMPLPLREARAIGLSSLYCPLVP